MPKKMKIVEIVDNVSMPLVVVGAATWGTAQWFNFNVVADWISVIPYGEPVVYSAVGASGFYMLGRWLYMKIMGK